MDDVATAYERIRSTADIFEKARLLQFLKKKEIRLTDIAAELKMKPAYVSHFLRLNKLPDIVVDGYYARLVTASHLFIIARLKDYASIVRVYERILAENLTSPATESIVREELYQTKSEGERIHPDDIGRMERMLQRALGTDIKLEHIQTRIHSKLILTTKGSLAHTTNVINKLYHLLKESVE